MLTLFTTPKPFQGHNGIIQKNAIHSWTLLHPDCEVILFGDDEGTAEIAAELGVRHVPQVTCNEYGTPLISAMFEHAQQLAQHSLVGYVNADIILMDDFIKALQVVQQRQKFLMVGQRWDLDLDEPLSFKVGWQESLLKMVSENGKPHGPKGIDFFVFPRGLWDDIPPFAVGRPRWDNWMIYQARHRGVPVIDVSKTVVVVHQNHNYAHVPQGTGVKYLGPEGDKNIGLVNPYTYVFTLDGADWLLTSFGIVPAITPRHLRQRLNAWLSFRYPKVRSKLNSISKRRPVR